MFAMIALVLMAFAVVTFVIGKIVGPEPVPVPVEASADGAVPAELPVERAEP